MNKKLLTLLVGIVLVAVLVSCNVTNLFKGKQAEEEVQPPAQEEQTEQQPPAEEEQPAKPPKKPVTPPPVKQDDKTEAEKAEGGTPATGTEEAEKIPKSSFGVIFVTNVRTGAFRVKMDDEKIIDHSFQGKKGGKADEMRFEREIKKIEPGEHKLKFVCEDNQGSKGTKEETFVFKPGEHKVFKITVKGAPGDIKLEILE